ncbi:hypothetical protein V6N13_137250 [Hibiscus sabdariffa]
MQAMHIDLKYVPQLCDVSYGGEWDPTIDVHGRLFPSCLETCLSQLVNLSLNFRFWLSWMLPLEHPKFPNLRYLACEVRNLVSPGSGVLLNLLPLVERGNKGNTDSEDSRGSWRVALVLEGRSFQGKTTQDAEGGVNVLDFPLHVIDTLGTKRWWQSPGFVVFGKFRGGMMESPRRLKSEY